VSDQFDAKAFLKTVTSQPGVYRMYDAGGTVIYVGKAKDLKKRLSSYFRSNLASRKTEALVAQIQQIDVTVTHTETEALLLEHNYIKLYQPRYNVLLRDDKSYPFIFLSGDTHPRLAMHRGAKHAKGEYFGPFPNGYAVRETLALLQKIFPIRQCENSVYRNRSRPCLQYQIGRCLGPCVEGLVSEEEYAQQVEYVRCFCLAKMIRCLRNSLVVWKLPARIWSLKKRRGFATKFRRCDVSPKNSLFPIPATTLTLLEWRSMRVWLVSTYCSFVRAKCSAAAAISRKCLVVRN